MLTAWRSTARNLKCSRLTMSARLDLVVIRACERVNNRAVAVLRGPPDDFRSRCVLSRVGRQRSQGERPARVSVDEQAGECRVVRQVAEVRRQELAGMLAHGRGE